MVSRLIRYPIQIPAGVEVKVNGAKLTVKGKLAELHYAMPAQVKMSQQDKALIFEAETSNKKSDMLTATAYALVKNMVLGVSEGFKKKLVLIGVGYRAQAQDKKLNLTVGFSHPVIIEMPEGVKVSTPSQTEIELMGSDKQVVSQVAAKIRAIRPPEPYKGKGIRYKDEVVKQKEVKKK